MIAFSYLAGMTLPGPASARDLDYDLQPVMVTEDVYAFIGSTKHFSRKNGGNIVNTGFVVGEDGVIVIDTGPSRLYGEQMLAAIRTITDKPIAKIYLTHHHPDHFLGNQAFPGATIAALPETIQAIKAEGEGLSENMYRLVGDWMLGTEVVVPTEAVTASPVTQAGRTLDLIPVNGHTAADLAILDRKSGVMFAGDVVFHNRTATTPHATLADWYLALETLKAQTFQFLVPGHGPVETDGRSIEQTLAYLKWLEATLRTAAEEGMEMTEVMAIEIPSTFDSLDVRNLEFKRSVSHLWPALVEETLPQAPPK